MRIYDEEIHIHEMAYSLTDTYVQSVHTLTHILVHTPVCMYTRIHTHTELSHRIIARPKSASKLPQAVLFSNTRPGY